MRKYKKMVACLLILCLFSTNSLTSFAQIVEDVRSEKETKRSEKEIFEYPNANIYSETDESGIQIEGNQSSTNIPEEEVSESPTSDSQNTDDNKKENTDNDTDKPTIEQPIIEKPIIEEETDQESKEDISDEKDNEPTSDKNKEEEQEETSKETKEHKEVSDEKVSDEKEEQSEEKEEELIYPVLDEEEDEFEELYGAPIEVTQYTKVYKTAEGAYKTVYSEIPNTYIDENGQEKEIDNTLEPIIEEKEIETVIDKEDIKEEDNKDIKEEDIKEENNKLLSIEEQILSNQKIKTDEENTTIKDEAIQIETEETVTEIKEVVTAYTNSSNNMEVMLPGEASESNGITLSKDDFTVTLQPVEGDYSKAAVKENAILYNQVYENINIQYTVETFGVKEDIILNEKTDKNVYTYKLAKEGLSAKLIDNVVYLFKEGENIPSMLLSAPLMKDEAGAESTNITLSLDEEKENYIVSMEADETWINSEERVYPIHIDPSIDTIDKDIVIYSICSNSNFLSSTTGYVGYDESYGKSRSYVIIGYPFTGMLPDNAVITSATLNLYQYAGNEKGKITCYRLEDALPHEAGIDGMTWKDTVSINREMAGEKSSFTSKKGKHEIDIRDTVSRWVEGIAPVHGLVLIANDETKTNAEFYTYESTGISKSRKPKIVIDWKYEGELDENAYTLNDTTINLRTLIEANINGKHFFHGVYADGEAKPGATVKYELNDTTKNFNSSVLAGFFKVFPDSSATNSLFPSGTTKYKDKLSNWQTMLPFVDYDFNVLYQISATASKDGTTGNKVKSESFLVYKVTQFDTLPKIAKYYGVPLNQMLFDNKAADMLVVKNNTLFIRNPKKNANKPYNPPKLNDAGKAQIDAMLMGRGLHCEFGFEPINLNTGNFFMEQTDASITDETKDFAITRNYNAKGADKNGLFGRGWQTEYEEQISMDENFNIIYSRGDGSSLIFTKNGNSYTSPAGYDYTLDRVAVGSRTVLMGTKEKSYKVYEYTITDHDKNKKTFNEYGYLTKITDMKNNTITLTYDENYFLRQIASSTGFIYKVTCNDNGNITAITLPNGKQVTYSYDALENLTSYTDELGITIRYEYDNNHRMTKWFDGNGTRVILNTYDSENRIVSQIDANGKESTLSYAAGRTITKDGNGDTTNYYYDDQYRTTKIIYPNGTSINRTYQNNQMVSETDPLSHTTSYEYDGNGNKIKETRFDGASKTFTYNANNLLTSQTDYEGKQTRYEYDGKLNLTKVIQPENQVVSYTYDGNNHLTKITDAKGNQTTFTYQGAWIRSVTDAKGQMRTITYNASGDITAVTDAAGKITSYTYDNAQRLIKETNGAGKSTDYTYDNAGNITSITDYNGAKTTFTHDGNGNVLSLKDPMGRTYSYEYDALGNRTKMVDPQGIITTYGYDSVGNNTTIINGEGNTFRYEYDAIGNLVKEIQPNQNAIVYSYDYRTNQITSITDDSGAKTQYTYSALGLLLEQMDALGRKTNYSYDGANRLKELTNANGLFVSYTYDLNNNITQAQYSDGKKYTFTYDKLNQVTAITLPNGGKLQYTYDAVGNLLKSVDALGYETTYAHDALGNMTARIDPNGNKTSYSFDGNNNVTQITDPMGNQTKYIIDSVNQITKIVDANQYVTEYTYDPSGNITAITDALNGKTDYEFDHRGLATKVTDANGNSYNLEYDANGNNTKIISPNGMEVTYAYDKRNLLIKSTDSEGLITSYQYDKTGHLIQEENNAGSSTTYTYDVMGNVASITNSMGQTTTYTYDKSKNLVNVVSFDGNQTKYDYDTMGNVIRITDPEGKVTKYEYDKNNRLISKEDHAMRTYQYTYDKLGNLTSDTNPLGEKNSYAYDALGNLTSLTDAAGNIQSLTYDKTGNIIANRDKNGNETKYTYDALGRVITVLNADGGDEQYLYDALGNLLKYQDALGYVTNYSYDSIGQLSELVTPNGGTYQYTYDGHGNNIKITNPLGAVTTMEYDKLGQMTNKIYPNSAKYSYEYDKIGRLTKIQAPQELFKQYEYNEVGDLIKERDQSGREISYTYDKQHRLLTTTNEENATTSYDYDERGNLSSVVTPLGGTSTYSYDALDRISSMTDPVGKITELTYDIQGNLTKITENGGRITSYSYDAMGNQTTVTNALDQTTKFEYDMRNQLAAIIDPMGQKTSYEYDKMGQITAIKDAKGNRLGLAYDGNGNITQLKDEEERTIDYTYNLADQLIQVTDSEQVETYYTYDTVGNLTSVTDGNQNTTSYTYDLLGKMTSMTNPLSEVQEFVYDMEGRLKEAKQPDGSTIKYDYNKLDQLVSISYGEEYKEQNVLYAYDEEGRQISMEDVTGTTSYTYDEAGRIGSVKTSDGKEIVYTYDEYGNLSKLTYPDGKAVSYSYDAIDRLTLLTDRNNRKTFYTYDEKGNLIQIERPNQTTTKLTYDILNQVTAVENLDAEDKIISAYYYTYDNSGFITKEEENRYKDKEKIKIENTFSYDLRGQLTKVISVENGKKSETRYTYDKAGNRICIEKSEETARKQLIENHYNKANRLITSIDSLKGETTYEYDANGNMVKELAPGEEIVEYSYDVENRLSSIKKQGTLLMAALYDGDGNRIFTVEKTKSSYEETIAEHGDFEHGEQSRQKPVEWDTYYDKTTWDHVIDTIKKTFIRYDVWVTLTKTTQTTTTTTTKTTDTNNSKGEPKEYAPTTTIDESKLYVDPTNHFFWYGFGQGIIQGFGGASSYLSSWFHDAWDYLTNQYYIVRHITTTEYENTKQNEDASTQAEIETITETKKEEETKTSPDGSMLDEKTEKEIKIEPMSREIEDFIPDDEPEALSGYEKILYDTVLIPSGTEEIERQNYRMTSYVNDVNQEYTQVLMEYDVNGEVASVYDYGVQRNSYTNQRRDASQTQYYIYDGRGSVSALTSIYGNAVVSYQYDAYGSATVSGDTYSPYQYNAEAVDWNTGLQYLRARYYNSNIGGFLTQDTYLGMLEDPLTLNLYTYTGNNPVNLMDPSGHWWAGSTVNKNGITIKSDNPFSKRDTYPKKPTSNTTKDDSKYGAAGIGRYIDMPGRLHIEKPNPGSTNGKAGIANYIDMPSANYDTYVDPTTQRLEDKYGTVTKQTTSYAYAGGKYITAMTAMEQIFCSAWEKAKTSIKNTVDGLPDPLIKIANFFKGVGDATLSNYLPIETKEGDVKYPIMYYSGKITGDVLNVLDMLFAVSQGGKAGGKGGSKTLAGADGNTQIVISADIDSAFAGALVGKVVGNDITEDIKKLEESIEKAKKGDSGNKGKVKSKAEKERDKLLDGAKENTQKKGNTKNYEKTGGEKKAQKDFNELNLKDIKEIDTKYGKGKTGIDSDGNRVIYRPGSETGGPTVEIQLPGKKKIKIRY